jgi:uncharacterized membrane protein YtjA (UPF0391 family)
MMKSDAALDRASHLASPRLARRPNAWAMSYESSCGCLTVIPGVLRDAASVQSVGQLNFKRYARGGVMLHYAVVFFVIALIAAVLGFSGIAAGAAGIAKILFFLFLIVAATTLAVGLSRRT